MSSKSVDMFTKKYIERNVDVKMSCKQTEWDWDTAVKEISLIIFSHTLVK